tara:strand:- start:4573 stop:5112 length:540 start_codon:yes stop_codon:yes gene_type:complete
MAKTDLQKRTMQEKLNSMDVDTILVTSGATTNSATANTFMWNDPIKIENAVPIEGGSALLHSIVGLTFSNTNENLSDAALIQNPYSLVFTSSSDGTGIGLGSSLLTASITSDVLSNTCGVVHMNNIIDLGRVALSHKANCGIVLKAESGSRDVYMWGIALSSDNYGLSLSKFRIGLIKD